MRHDSECKCVKADESCFANLVVSEIKGESDDAMLIATPLVSPAFALDLVTYSVEFRSALQKIHNHFIVSWNLKIRQYTSSSSRAKKTITMVPEVGIVFVLYSLLNAINTIFYNK